MELKNEVVEVDKLKATLIKKVALECGYPRDLVEKIVDYQFRELVQVLRVHNDAMISGFGNIKISRPMAQRKLKVVTTQRNKILVRIETGTYTPDKLRIANSKLKQLNEIIEYLQEKLRVYESRY